VTGDRDVLALTEPLDPPMPVVDCPSCRQAGPTVAAQRIRPPITVPFPGGYTVEPPAVIGWVLSCGCIIDGEAWTWVLMPGKMPCWIPADADPATYVPCPEDQGSHADWVRDAQDVG
jgi:hypothetical protein